MANINLLPWREAQRRERNRITLFMCVAIWALAGLMVLVAKFYMDGRIEHQEARNQYLKTETQNLARIIKEIEDLKEKRDQLVARMEVIQTLQRNRSHIVHVFDDLVKRLPKGVYFESVEKAKSGINIIGIAQANGRVSTLMTNLDRSDWFENPVLRVVDVVDEDGMRVSKFNVGIKEQQKGAQEDDEGSL